MIRDSILAMKVLPSPGVFPSGVLVYFRRMLFPGLNMGNEILGSAMFSPVISVLCLSPSAFSFLLLPLLFLWAQPDMKL